MARGELSEAEAAVHPHRHILTRALGISPQVEVDVWEVVPVEGDRYLLCSDGLSNEVVPDVIAQRPRRRCAIRGRRPRRSWTWPTTRAATTTSPPSSSTSSWANRAGARRGRRRRPHRRGDVTGGGRPSPIGEAVADGGAAASSPAHRRRRRRRHRRRPAPHDAGAAPDHLPGAVLSHPPGRRRLRRLVRHQGLRGRLLLRRAPEEPSWSSTRVVPAASSASSPRSSPTPG